MHMQLYIYPITFLSTMLVIKYTSVYISSCSLPIILLGTGLGELPNHHASCVDEIPQRKDALDGISCEATAYNLYNIRTPYRKQLNPIHPIVPV